MEIISTSKTLLITNDPYLNLVYITIQFVTIEVLETKNDQSNIYFDKNIVRLPNIYYL